MPTNAPTYRSVAIMFAGLVAILAVGWVAGYIITNLDGVTRSVDRPVLEWLADARRPFLNDFMKAVTTLGGAVAIAIVATAGAIGVFLWKRDLVAAGVILVATLGGATIDNILKPLVGRERPDLDRLIDIGGDSFPSGHATAIAATWLAIALVVHLRSRSGAPWMWGLAAVVIVTVALSRPYLGVHYPTDVVAGSLLSASWVAISSRGMGLVQLRGTE